MLDIEFNLNQSIITIQANLEESFNDVMAMMNIKK